MEITYLRGATTIIEMAGRRILTDPWLEDGIYYGAWAHYPQWTTDDWAKYKPWDVDYIYVSHIHPDHFDPATMRRLARYGPSKLPKVLINKFPSSFLKKRIEECDFEVIEIESGTAYSLGGPAHIRIYPADYCNPDACGHMFSCLPLVRSTQVDSLAVFHDGHSTLVNVNDCPWGLADKVCHKIAGDYPEITYALVAYAGAGPWPQCFKLDNLTKATGAQKKKVQFTNAVADFARTLKAKATIPFAGDYQLCGPLSAINEYRGIPEPYEIHDRLRDMGVPIYPLFPGDSTSATFSDLGSRYSWFDRIAYVCDTLSGRTLSYAADPLPTQKELLDLCWPAFDRFHAKRLEYGLKAKTAIYIKLDNSVYFCIPPDAQPNYSSGPTLQPNVVIETDPRLLKLLLSGPKHAHWNNAEIGSHLMFKRSGKYEPGVHHLMSFFHA